MKLVRRLFAMILLFSCTLASTASAWNYEKFTMDEINAPDEWAVSEVQAASDAGLLTENTNNYYRSNITRFQFAELSVNLMEKLTGKEITPAPDTTFTDCTEPAVLKAYAAGITTGTGGGTSFSPDSNITREQIATMLVRAVAAVEKETGKAVLTATGDLSAYTDASSVSPWAKDGVTALNAARIMKGTSASTLSPQGTTTIQEAVILVLRIYKITLA